MIKEKIILVALLALVNFGCATTYDYAPMAKNQLSHFAEIIDSSKKNISVINTHSM